jgi:cyclopropane-fatty-acyl-phospholipid synthase
LSQAIEAPAAAAVAAPRSVVSLIDWCERGLVPDALTRLGMRMLMRTRLKQEGMGGAEASVARLAALVRELRASPIAIETASANQQHYEVPAAFFHSHLGPCLKYSSCLYPTGNETLAEAEIAMLELTAQRAGLADGQRILDLGCGWGSLSLWMAARFPKASITGISNSRGQREFIMKCAAERGLSNLSIITADIVDFEFDHATLGSGFDRIASIEMFEHMKNYAALFKKVSAWLKDDGRLFVHVFAHREFAYHFSDNDDSDWMTRYFFTGGLMPSQSLLLCFPEHLAIENQWWVDGRHYQKTSNHWLQGMDHARDRIMPVFQATYGADAERWFQRWRMFYMAVAELFGYANGSQWGVAHYLFKPQRGVVRTLGNNRF